MLSNADGSVIQHGPEFVGRLVDQVAAPVRWDLCMKTLGELGVTAVIELPPAGTLVGLIKRALPDVETLALKTPDDLDAARELIEKHRHDIEFSATPSVAVAGRPARRHLRGHRRRDRRQPGAGAVIGQVVTRREAQEVVASQGARWSNGSPRTAIRCPPVNRSPACTPMSASDLESHEVQPGAPGPASSRSASTGPRAS